MNIQKLIGPFSQIVTMRGLSLKGSLGDTQLEVITDGGIIVEKGRIVAIDQFRELAKKWDDEENIEEINEAGVLLPGFVDPHSHICWAGNRANDFALMLGGKTYIEIAEAGGGIWSTVLNTREATREELIRGIRMRSNSLMKAGTTTIEVKSGYGLNKESELKILEAISEAKLHVVPDLVPTCLAAHILPKDFDGSADEYLQMIISDLLPEVKRKKLANRVDIYVDKGAFTVSQAERYLQRAIEMGFDVTVHADQFSKGGSITAIKVAALSADHLENSGDEVILKLARSNTIAVALPGSSLGMGEPFVSARKLLDAGASLAIGSDWNPGSAPMGDLLVQASILGVYEKLSIAEILSAITFRSAAALNLFDRGILETGKLADFSAFPVHDFREIIYNQGRIKPCRVWKGGHLSYKYV